MRKNIASVKVVKLPSDWTTSTSDFGNTPFFGSGFKVISTLDFINAVNANPNLTGRPRIGTVIDNRLKIFPVPTADYAGAELEFLVYLKSATTTISKTIEPELPEVFDKCLEYFATSQFLSGKDRVQWQSDYRNELMRLRPIEHRKHFNLSRPAITGWK